MPSSTPSPPVPGLRERKKARTRATIQREALRLFARDGYTATAVEQIAAAADVSPSTFFRYFPTKEDVVLAEFLDSRVIERVADAPARLTLVAALRHAMETVGARMDPEDLELERLRNQLIRSVPELRRGMVAELVRPVALLAAAFARRLGRPDDDPDVRTYAGAVIGALALSEAATDPDDVVPERLFDDLVSRFDRVERILVQPTVLGS